jgi:hypothetical protein
MVGATPSGGRNGLMPAGVTKRDVGRVWAIRAIERDRTLRAERNEPPSLAGGSTGFAADHKCSFWEIASTQRQRLTGRQLTSDAAGSKRATSAVALSRPPRSLASAISVSHATRSALRAFTTAAIS